MVASRYCERADLHEHGLPRGALPNPGRLVAAVSTATDTLTLDGHGLALDEAITFRSEVGTLPAELVAGTTYYAKPLTDNTFQVAATPGGAAINLTTAGSRIVVVAALPIDAAIEYASALIDDFLSAHAVPLVAPYPVIVVAATAQLAIAKLLSYTGQAPGTLSEAILAAQKLIERWAKGIPLRGPIVPPSANLAVTGVVSGTDPRGWAPEDGSLP